MSLTGAEQESSLAPAGRERAAIGPLTLTVEPDPDRGRALVTAALGGVAARQLLSLARPVLTLDLVDGPASASGSLILRLRAAPHLSSVAARIVTADASGSHPFEGEVASWPATGDPVVDEIRMDLGGDLSTLVTVRGAAANIADFAFYSGSVLMGALTATQFAPLQVFPDGLQVGEVRIEAGAAVTLTIPTHLQSGMLFLQATISSLTAPETRVGASVARWPLPPTP